MNDSAAHSETVIRRARQAVRTDELLGISDTLLRPSGPLLGNIATEPVTGEAMKARGGSVPDRMDREPPAAIAAPARTVISNVGVPEVSGDTAEERMTVLRSLHEENCPHCSRASEDSTIVFGEGSLRADLMFVGEAPGAEEERTGRPFVGRSGQKLDQMIQAMGFAREDVYITNVVKSRPPDNRTPLQHEIDACSPYLAEQVRIIDPRVIVTLGGPASKLLLGSELGITKLRGVWGAYQVGDGTYPVMPTFHPAYLLRNYTPEVRGQVWNDLQAAMVRLQDDPEG